MVLPMASFAWPSVMVLKGSRLLGRTILKCSWDASMLELNIAVNWSQEVWNCEAPMLCKDQGRIHSQPPNNITNKKRRIVVIFLAQNLIIFIEDIHVSFSCLPYSTIQVARATLVQTYTHE